ncbi:L-fucose operon activator [Salmonella enterica]|nr:L-fucose operon activator [Salmonella enterica]
MKKISLPKIGIRPVIDGRRMGVRESLEEQTMNMAKATAALITEKIRHACGAQVECVIADTCIAGMAESAACEEKFSSQNVGVTITVTPCWCYGSETIDMDPMRPKAIWGFNGTERPGAVYLAAALAAHSQKGIPAFSIYGHDVQDADDTSIPADVEEKLLRFARAGLAWIEEGMTIALDASSTCWYLARQLPDIPIQVFTNSHPICQELGKRERIALISSGGQLERKYGCYVNPSLISQLKSLDIDLFIFSCEGIDGGGDLWDSNAINADFKSILLRRASQSLLLIDKSKFNRSGEARIGHLDDVTHIVSDAPQS